MAPSIDKPTILIVDDTPENLDILGGILRKEYKVKAALNGEKALRIATGSPRPDMILLDIMMPEMDGYEVCQRLKENPATNKIPIIFITAKAEVADERKGLELGAVDYITKPISPPIVDIRVRTQLALYNQQRELERLVKERTSELLETRLEIIRRLGRAAEFKDNETGLHVIRMSHYTRLMVESMDISEEWADLVFHAAPMHDIGKIGIPDAVLLKPGKLNDEEWNIMRRHPEYGAAIIGDHSSPLLAMSQEISLSHHEKWDGTGYPKGLKGEDIPISGRVVAIADVFDALTSERPYKKAWSVEKAVDVIKKDAGTHFDPNLVPIFVKILPEALKIKEKYADDPHFNLDESSGI
ncbi:MAG: two-component system response regulator [Magnetococcales bacterium]|nr:two-component system response regulator [Magnetococcales bacterium]